MLVKVEVVLHAAQIQAQRKIGQQLRDRTLNVRTLHPDRDSLMASFW